MQETIMEIDLTKVEPEQQPDDILRIKFGRQTNKNSDNSHNNNDNDSNSDHDDEETVVEVSFSKLFIESGYIRRLCLHGEGLESAGREIEAACEARRISAAGARHFFELVSRGRGQVPASAYSDVYRLGEFLEAERVVRALEAVSGASLCRDVPFTLELLLAAQASDSGFTTGFTATLESFLSQRVNECLVSARFGDLPAASAFRVVAGGGGSVDAGLLADFACASLDRRFALLSLVDAGRLGDAGFERLLSRVAEQGGGVRASCEACLRLDSGFVLGLLRAKTSLSKELAEARAALSQSKTEHAAAMEDLAKKGCELEEARMELARANEALSQSRRESAAAAESLDLKRGELEQAGADLARARQELHRAREELDQIKREARRAGLAARVCGLDEYCALVEHPNNEACSKPCVHPPVELRADSSSLLSYSAVACHSVQVTRSGSLVGTGFNRDGRIIGSLPRETVGPSEFSIPGLEPVSAACLGFGTLYMLTKSGTSERQLFLSHSDAGEVLLDAGGKRPVALFSGIYNAAAISSDGEVILVNPGAVSKPGGSRVASCRLPGGEAAASVACCRESLFALSSRGRVFESRVDSGSGAASFAAVPELGSHEIVCVSGIYKHCVAVSCDGRVFARGSNQFGQLGLGEGARESREFAEVASLRGSGITAAYAGTSHTLFVGRGGRVLACGGNDCGQLFLASGPSGACVYSPAETAVTSGATFCIAGNGFSVVFVGVDPPPNTPNTRVGGSE